MFYLIDEEGVPRSVDIPEESLALFAGMNPHIIHFEGENLNGRH